jgi:hypothetical protein
MHLWSLGNIELRRKVGKRWMQKTLLFSVEANKIKFSLLAFPC